MAIYLIALDLSHDAMLEIVMAPARARGGPPAGPAPAIHARKTLTKKLLSRSTDRR